MGWDRKVVRARTLDCSSSLHVLGDMHNTPAAPSPIVSLTAWLGSIEVAVTGDLRGDIFTAHTRFEDWLDAEGIAYDSVSWDEDDRS